VDGELLSVLLDVRRVEHGLDPSEIFVGYDGVEGVEDDSSVLVEEGEFE